MSFQRIEQNKMNISTVLLVLASCTAVYGYTCDMALDVCETSLIIEHYITMNHPVHRQVYAEDGQLWKYDVTNISQAVPIDAEEVIITDGWETGQLVVVANKTMPGPDIIVYEGQTLVIKVHNKLFSDSVTIHWHGLPQEGTPYMDGVAFVTQCPIMAGQSFTYRFKATPKGTYWYHSHIGSQRVKGLFGALIIREREANPLPEHILQIQGWNHDADGDLGFQHMLYGIYKNRQKHRPSRSLDGSFFSLFDVQSGLINGKGRYVDPKTNSSIKTPLEIFSVEKGKAYRFRVIAVGALYPFRISVDNHSISIIESDGYNVKPKTVESFIINPGERFDFILNANQSVDNYWIRGQTLEINKVTMAKAILRYAGAPAEEPTMSFKKSCSENNKCVVLNCPFTYYPADDHIECLRIDHLKSDNDNDAAPPVKNGQFKEYFLNFAFPGITSFPSSVNGRSFKLPAVSGISQPSQIETTCDKEDCGEEKQCFCSYTVDLKHGDTVQMVFLNMGVGSGWSHPIHMHGHSFYVLKMGYANYNETTGRLISANSDIDCRGGKPKHQSFCNDATWSNPSWANGNVPGLELQNPVRKDTIIVPSGSYVVVRIKADNPGLWIMHCHIELHSSDGMAMLLNESFGNLPKVPEGFPVCNSYPPPPKQQSEKPKPEELDDDEGTISRLTFWIVVGVLSAVIVMQILLFTYFSKRRNSGKTEKHYVTNGHQNMSFSNDVINTKSQSINN